MFHTFKLGESFKHRLLYQHPPSQGTTWAGSVVLCTGNCSWLTYRGRKQYKCTLFLDGDVEVFADGRYETFTNLSCCDFLLGSKYQSTHGRRRNKCPQQFQLLVLPAFLCNVLGVTGAVGLVSVLAFHLVEAGSNPAGSTMWIGVFSPYLFGVGCLLSIWGILV